MKDEQLRVKTMGLQQYNEHHIRSFGLDVSIIHESENTDRQTRDNVRRTNGTPRRTKSEGGRKQNLCNIVVDQCKIPPPLAIILAPLIMKVKESALRHVALPFKRIGFTRTLTQGGRNHNDPTGEPPPISTNVLA